MHVGVERGKGQQKPAMPASLRTLCVAIRRLEQCWFRNNRRLELPLRYIWFYVNIYIIQFTKNLRIMIFFLFMQF